MHHEALIDELIGKTIPTKRSRIKEIMRQYAQYFSINLRFENKVLASRIRELERRPHLRSNYDEMD